MPGTRTVQGHVILPAGVLVAPPAEVIVRIEDISRADAPSRIVGERRLEPGARDAVGIPFSLEVAADDVDPKAFYSVWAHVDVSGSGEIDRGDLISMQTYPVLTHGYGDEVDVVVKQA